MVRQASVEPGPGLVEAAGLAGRETEHGIEPPILAPHRRERAEKLVLLLFVLKPAAEAVEAEHTGRRRDHHRIARPGLHVPQRRGNGLRRLAFDAEAESVDVTLLAQRRARGQLTRLGCSVSSERGIAGHELATCERDKSQRECRIGVDSAAEVAAISGDGRDHAVHAGDIGVARAVDVVDNGRPNRSSSMYVPSQNG